ncbi:MAG: hypothetical protein ACK58T_21905, partial [Phycisphaerae bacterium]
MPLARTDFQCVGLAAAGGEMDILVRLPLVWERRQQVSPCVAIDAAPRGGFSMVSAKRFIRPAGLLSLAGLAVAGALF